MSKMPHVPHTQHEYDWNEAQAKRHSPKSITRWNVEGEAKQALHDCHDKCAKYSFCPAHSGVVITKCGDIWFEERRKK